MKCREKQCDNTILARGWCRKHYLRWYKYGDPSVIKLPADYVLKGKSSPNFKHGHWDHKLYGTWKKMIDRCDNPKNRNYENYGGRGVRVCSQWYDIEQFIKDMGPKPSAKHSVDRINNNGNYEPNNCRWASDTIQGMNRRCVKLTLEKAEEIRNIQRRRANGKGDGYTRQEIADMYGVSVATIKKVLSGEYWKPHKGDQ